MSAEILALHWPGDVSSPWRVHIPMNALRQAGYNVVERSILQEVDPGDADLVVLHRPASKQALELILEARRRGASIVVDLDDLLIPELLPEGTLIARAWDPLAHRKDAEERVAAGLDGPAAIANAPRNKMAERLRDCIAAADVVTVSSRYLAEFYASCNSNIHVLRNCYDDTNPLWNIPACGRQTINIGFAGSEHHMDNVALLDGVLEPILRAHPHVRVVEAGGVQLLPRMHAPAEQLIHLGSLPFNVLPLLLQQMDIAIAPLADGPFTRAKSEIRCMMAGLVGAPVVASPVGTYAEYVEHGVNGFHASSKAEWSEYVETLIRNDDLRQTIGAANRKRAQTYAMSANVWRWIDTYDSVLDRRRCA